MATNQGRRVKGRFNGGRVAGGTLFGGWLSSQSYEIGDNVTRLNVLYRCILAHSNQQPPNATYWTVGVDGDAGGGGGAPTTAEYLVGASDATLSAERVVTDTASVTWDLATAAQAKAKRAALTGDVTASADSNATTIAAAAVTLAKLADLATDKVIGRVTAGTGPPEAVTFADPVQAIAALTTPTYRISKVPQYGSAAAPNAEAPAFRSMALCLRHRWSLYPSGTTILGVGCTAQVPGGLTSGSSARGRALVVSTTATLGQEREIRDGGSDVAQARQSPIMLTRLLLGADITSQRFWIGFVVGSAATTNSDTLASVSGSCCLRYSAGVDTNWMLCTWNGAAQTVVDTGIPVTASHEYVLVVYTDDAGVTWRATVYDVTAATSGSVATTLTPPSVSVDVGPTCSFTATAAVVRSYTWYGMDGESAEYL